MDSYQERNLAFVVLEVSLYPGMTEERPITAGPGRSRMTERETPQSGSADKVAAGPRKGLPHPTVPTTLAEESIVC